MTVYYYIVQYRLSVYVFVQHSIDEISLGQTVTLFLKFETMHSFPEAMVSRYPWVEGNDAEDGCQQRCIIIHTYINYIYLFIYFVTIDDQNHWISIEMFLQQDPENQEHLLYIKSCDIKFLKI